MSAITSDEFIGETVARAHTGLMATRGRLLVYSGLGIALLVRLLLVFSANFPLNDGGMFAVMIRNLQASHYALPNFTDYNGMHIPFAYPPLAFYAAAFLSDLTHADPITILRILPLLMSIATIGAFGLLANAILESSDAAVIATVAFGFLPHSVIWQVMGGGLTRGFGLFFAILALRYGYELFAHQAMRRAAPTALFAGLTVLSHPKMSWLLAYSLALFFFWYGRNRNGLLGASIVVSATLALTSPWWIVVIARHGLAPFLASAQTGSTSAGTFAQYFLALDMTGETLLPVLAFLALLGIARLVQARRWLLLVWLAVMIPLDPREFMTDMLLPIALLIGIGTMEVLYPWLVRIEWLHATRWSRRITPIITLLALLYFGLSLVAACVSVDVPLSNGDRAAMTWAMKDTPANSRFLVISGSSQWWTDRQAEWFPALADRMSVATVQGTEWLTTKPFSDHVSEYNAVQRCAGQTAACLDAWSTKTDTSFDYVYVSKTVPIQASYGVEGGRVDKPHEFVLDLALRSDRRYSLVFENASAEIYKRN
jgi:hypothetical protein